MRKVERINPFLKWIGGEWMKNPDMRFGQLLINLNIIPNDIRAWHSELEDYLIPHEYARTIFSWNMKLTKDNIDIQKCDGCWDVRLKDYSSDIFWQLSYKKPTLKEIYNSCIKGINVYIYQLNTKHIRAILKTQGHIKGTYIETILKEELKYRRNKKIK